MPIHIVQDDITRMEVDVIVNAAKKSLLGGGGVDGAIHQAAGPALAVECRMLGGCPTGEARITKGYRLPAGHVIHTVGPIWEGGDHGEAELLASCYRSCMKLASEHGFTTIAFPLISAGIYGYPKAQALRIALDTIAEHITDDMTVYMVIFRRERDLIDRSVYDDISDRLTDMRINTMHVQSLYSAPLFDSDMMCDCDMGASFSDEFHPCPSAVYTDAAAAGDSRDDLDLLLSRLDEGFSRTLMQLIDRSGMTDAQCYKKANIDRKLFSKIRSDEHYRPSKSTALAFAVALELDIDQTCDLLQRAGFALSPSSEFDVIVEYFIRRKIYDVMRINEALFAFDQPLLAG